MGAATELTAATFEETIGSGVTLVDFWAEWCGPCKMIAPAIDALAEEYDGKATIAKVNVDNESDLAMKFNVSSIPTLLVFKDGEVAETFIGVRSKDDLAAALDAAIG
jgi:thioredoxin 1